MVNRSFVNEVLHGTNPLGRRLRYSGQVDDGQSTAPEVWYQIVGVVNDYPAVPMELDSPRAMVYHPIADGESVELMAIRLAGVPPSSFGERLRQITATVDPSLRLTDIRPLDVALREGHFALRMGAFGIVIVTMSVLLLAAAGIYALMSFTVERRRREIGIRVALGADRTRVVRGVFGRALRQLAIGVGVGAAIAPLILRQVACCWSACLPWWDQRDARCAYSRLRHFEKGRSAPPLIRFCSFHLPTSNFQRSFRAPIDQRLDPRRDSRRGRSLRAPGSRERLRRRSRLPHQPRKDQGRATHRWIARVR
jgi:hypothetical protein